MKIFYTLILAFAFGCTTAKKNTALPIHNYVTGSQAFHDTMARLDSIFFDAYNNCRIEVFELMISDSIEFYHDQGGLTTSKSELITALKNNICGKVRRNLLAGSIEVYTIPNFGAIQFGQHQFFNIKENSASRYSKFVHTWKREGNAWKLYRVISLH
jgi:hypothetical protein